MAIPSEYVQVLIDAGYDPVEVELMLAPVANLGPDAPIAAVDALQPNMRESEDARRAAVSAARVDWWSADPVDDTYRRLLDASVEHADEEVAQEAWQGAPVFKAWTALVRHLDDSPSARLAWERHWQDSTAALLDEHGALVSVPFTFPYESYTAESLYTNLRALELHDTAPGVQLASYLFGVAEGVVKGCDAFQLSGKEDSNMPIRVTRDSDHAWVDVDESISVLGTNDPEFAGLVTRFLSEDTRRVNKEWGGLVQSQIHAGLLPWHVDGVKAAPPGKGPQRFERGDKRGGQFKPKDDNSRQMTEEDQAGMQPVTGTQRVIETVTQAVRDAMTAQGETPNDAFVQMYLDAMSLSRQNFIEYGKQLGFGPLAAEHMADLYFSENREISRKQAQARWDFEASRTMAVTAFGGRTMDIVSSKANKRLDDKFNAVADADLPDSQKSVKSLRRVNPHVQVKAEARVPDAWMRRTLAKLDAAVKGNAALARVFKEQVRSVDFTFENRGALASWDNVGKRLIFNAGNGNSTAPVFAGAISHELGHAAENYFDAPHMGHSGVAKLFGGSEQARSAGRVSRQAWMNEFEAAAELFSAMSSGDYADDLEDFAPEHVQAFTEVMPWLKWSKEEWERNQ